MQRTSRGISIVLAGVLASACGSAGDWFPSDVDQAATLDHAGAAVIAKVCDAFEDFIYDQYRGSLLVEIACTAQGIEESTNSAACSDFVQACIDTPPPEVEALASALLAASGCGAVDYQPSGCSKTISELRACLDAIDAEVASLKYDVVCALAGQPLPPDALAIETPAACLSIENACPLP